MFVVEKKSPENYAPWPGRCFGRSGSFWRRGATARSPVGDWSKRIWRLTRKRKSSRRLAPRTIESIWAKAACRDRMSAASRRSFSVSTAVRCALAKKAATPARTTGISRPMASAPTAATTATWPARLVSGSADRQDIRQPGGNPPRSRPNRKRAWASDSLLSGQLQDGLALEPLSGYARAMIPFFAHHPYARVVVLTKSADVENLLDLGHAGRTILSWTVNAPEVVEHFERNTPNVMARLEAMRRCA